MGGFRIIEDTNEHTRSLGQSFVAGQGFASSGYCAEIPLAVESDNVAVSDCEWISVGDLQAFLGGIYRAPK